METQKFKGDATELKYEAAAAPAFDLMSSALDDFLAGGYDSAPFLLMLYDQKRIPFSDRINRDAFVVFIREALKRFPFFGNFDTYLFVLRAIFGSDAQIIFQVTAPGKLSISINAVAALTFRFITSLDPFTVVTMDGEQILFRGLTGIDTQYELELLFSELMPAGIIPDIALTFYEFFPFIANDVGETWNITDTFGNRILFWQVGD